MSTRKNSSPPEPATAKQRYRTQSGLPLKEVYTESDLAGSNPPREIGNSGEYPFTRGIHRTMYRGKPWTIRQFSGFGSAVDTNRRLRFLLEQGQHGLSTAFDLPTLMGPRRTLRREFVAFLNRSPLLVRPGGLQTLRLKLALFMRPAHIQKRQEHIG